MREAAAIDVTLLFAVWLCGSVVLVYFPLALGSLVFHPLFERVYSRPAASMRYSLADLFVLLVHLQCGAGVLLVLWGPVLLSERIALWLTLATAQVAWWMASLSWLARWPQIAARDRVWFLAVIAPIGFLCGAVLLPGLALAFVALVAILSGEVYWFVVLIAFNWIFAGLGILFTRSQCRGIVARQVAHAAALPLSVRVRANV